MTTDRAREGELIERLKAAAHTNELKCVVELLTLRREKHRNSLEAENSDETRGRSKECKDLVNILVS